jgi:hypothetical protein
VSTRPTRASTLTSAPKNLADCSHAAETAPIPPSGYPQLAICPSPTSPTEWCISTYAVPGASGPAHVPMMPFTAMNPFMTGDSNQRSSRSAALIENNRVTSATVFALTSLRSFHASLATSRMSRGFFDPSSGGVSISIGPRIAAIHPIHSSKAG